MFSQYSYPIICAQDLATTVNFYEDHFDFEVAVEVPGFVILKRKAFEDMHIAVIDKDHEQIPEAYRTAVKGMILSMPMHDVQAAFKELYWEGLTVVSEPAEAPCGRLHALLEDPNGILIDISENIPIQHFCRSDGTLERPFISDVI